MTRPPTAAAAAAAVAAATAVLAGCGGPQRPAQPAAPPASVTAAMATPTAVPVRVVAHHSGKRYIQLSETKQDRVVYTLQADDQTAQRAPSGDGTSVFTNPRVRFVATDGKVLFAQSPTGTVTEQAKAVSVLMSGRVHAHTADGTTLESDTLVYDDAAQLIHARGNVVLTTATERLQGGALDADLRLDHVHLTPGDS